MSEAKHIQCVWGISPMRKPNFGLAVALLLASQSKEASAVDILRLPRVLPERLVLPSKHFPSPTVITTSRCQLTSPPARPRC